MFLCFSFTVDLTALKDATRLFVSKREQTNGVKYTDVCSANAALQQQQRSSKRKPLQTAADQLIFKC